MEQAPDPMRERYLARMRSKHISTLVGIVAVALGYYFLAVPPGTAQGWVLARIALGFLFIMIGFWMAVLPLLNRIFGVEDKE